MKDWGERHFERGWKGTRHKFTCQHCGGWCHRRWRCHVCDLAVCDECIRYEFAGKACVTCAGDTGPVQGTVAVTGDRAKYDQLEAWHDREQDGPAPLSRRFQLKQAYEEWAKGEQP